MEEGLANPHWRSVRNHVFGRLELKGEQISVTAPAHPHVTDAAVYTALLLKSRMVDSL